MGKYLQKIRQEIEQLEQQSKDFFTELNELYKRYLEALNFSLKKQLILAVYEICTKIYPEEFLLISYSKREKFQGKIRELCQPIESKFLAYITFPQPRPTATLTEPILTQLSLMNNQEFQVEDNSEDDSLSQIDNPEDLVLWSQRVEQGVRMILHNLSQDVNRELQTNNIIANQLPPQVLEMALQAEEGGASSGNPPNILNLLIETNRKDKEDEKENGEDEDNTESQITRISAIHLRLSDLEFADPQLSIQRQQIRHRLDIVKKMRKAYEKIQRENSQAQAEAAWRSSWHE